jgi:hypothetical protein
MALWVLLRHHSRKESGGNMSQFAAGPLPAVMPEELLYGVEGAVATATLNAPQRMNTIFWTNAEAAHGGLGKCE